MEVPDFLNANIHWITHPEGIEGIWEVASVLRLSPKNGSEQCSVLGAGVFAGRIFAEHPLVDTNTYFYQFAVSDNHQYKIFRTGINAVGDTSEEIEKRFKAVNIMCPWIDLAQVKLQPNFMHALSMIVKVTTQMSDGRAELFFPIKHANFCHQHQFQFQVETGPILLPDNLLDTGIENLTIGYAYFNSFDQLTWLLRSQTGFDRVQVWSDVQIEFYK